MIQDSRFILLVSSMLNLKMKIGSEPHKEDIPIAKSAQSKVFRASA